jgi:hypothetical protein
MVQNRVQSLSLVGFVFLAIAIFSSAASVPFQVHLPLKTPFLKLSWRQFNMIPFLALLAGVQTYFDKEFKFREILHLRTLGKFIVIALIGDLMSLFGVFAG